MGRERLDAQAAFERLRGAARSSTRRLADVARDVTDGQPLPANRRTLAKARGRTGQAAGERLRTIGPIGQDLRFDVRFSPFHLVDADGDGDPSLGDYPVFHDILLRDGEEVGDEGGTCPIVDVEQGLIHCTGTMRLPGGQLTFQGLTTTAPTKQLAITGGTGRYQGVGGEATLVELGDGTGTLRVRLRR